MLSVASYLAHRHTGNAAALKVTRKSLKCFDKMEPRLLDWPKKANIYTWSSTTGNPLNVQKQDATSNLNLHFYTWMS